MEICVFGSAIVDFICYVKRLPKAGETLHGHKFNTGFGGKGANQCVAAARLGASTALIAKLGDDVWGANYLQQLRKEGVNVDFVEKCLGVTTGVAQISVSAEGENHIIIVAGANERLTSGDAKRAENHFYNAKILICQLETPIDATIAALRSFDGISILNAAPALKDTPKELLKLASIFCVNESEAALMIGCDAIKTLPQSKVALQRLIEMGAKTVIITLGAMGAVYARSDKPQHCVHVPVRLVRHVVDTTGAGDAFIGALAFVMARYPDLDLHQHVGAACEVAAYSVQYPGTQASFPKATDVDIDPKQRQFDWKLI